MGTRKSLPSLKTSILRFLPLPFFLHFFSLQFSSSEENEELNFFLSKCWFFRYLLMQLDCHLLFFPLPFYIFKCKYCETFSCKITSILICCSWTVFLLLLYLPSVTRKTWILIETAQEHKILCKVHEETILFQITYKARAFISPEL